MPACLPTAGSKKMLVSRGKAWENEELKNFCNEFCNFIFPFHPFGLSLGFFSLNVTSVEPYGAQVWNLASHQFCVFLLLRNLSFSVLLKQLIWQ